MLTFEGVLAVFADYLQEDTRYEVLSTSRGRTVMEWDCVQRDWAGAQLCATPEELKEALLEAYTGYLEYRALEGEALDVEGQVGEMSRRLLELE